MHCRAGDGSGPVAATRGELDSGPAVSGGNILLFSQVSKRMKLDVYSDIICPWCYLGHRRLDAAIEELGSEGASIEVGWRAFRLDPGATAEPKDLRRALERKYGPGAFDEMTRRLTALGPADGIDYRFDKALRVDTFDAHRLLQWVQATTPGRTDAMADRLFRAYFTEGENVADRNVLARLAGDVGIASDSAGELLASNGFADVVEADLARAVEVGVTGVPAVVRNGAVVVPGAQEVDTMVAILRRLLSKAG